MEGIIHALREHAVVGFDTPVFIYHVEAHSRYADLCAGALGAAATGLITAVTSVLTLMEVTVRPMQFSRDDAAAEYEALTRLVPNLLIADITAPVARRAAAYRAAQRVAPADALRLAACVENGATAFVTNDKRLRHVADMQPLILEDFLSPAQDVMRGTTRQPLAAGPSRGCPVDYSRCNWPRTAPAW